MQKGLWIAIPIIIVAILVFAAFQLLGNEEQETSTTQSGADSSNDETSTPPTTPPTTPPLTAEPPAPPAAPPAAAGATITYGSGGFSSGSVTLGSGGKLTIVNNSSQSLDFASDPHPIHTINPELNAGAISAGSSKTITLNTKGSFGVHNHLNSSRRATIVVN